MKHIIVFLTAVFLTVPAFAATSIPFTVNMSEAVNVVTTGGTPRIAVDVGGVTRYASYASGTGTSALTFTYAAVAGDVDLDGVTLTSPMDLNGGTVKDLAGNNAALTFTLPNTTGIKVDYPSLDMDFLADADGRFSIAGTVYNSFTAFLTAASGTFARASTATYYDSAGLLQTATANTPRFDYDPVTHVAKGLLIEEARTNLLIRSEDFSVGIWNPANATKTANTTDVVDPQGGNTAAKVVYVTSNAQISQGVAVTEGIPYTASVWVRGSGSINFSLLEFGGAYTTYAVTPYTLTNTWTRISVTGTKAVDGFSLGVYLFPQTGTTLYLWGAQLEQASFPTSYIKTVASSASRAADSFLVPSGSWFNTNVGAWMASFDGGRESTQGTFGRVIGFHSVRTILSTDCATTLQVGTWDGAGGICKATASDFVTTAGKGAMSYDNVAKTRSLTARGLAATTSSYTNSYDITSAGIALGRNVSSASNMLNGHIGIVRYYPLRMTDTQLQLLTQ